MKKIINKIPLLRNIASWLYFKLIVPFKNFNGSGDYWQKRYQKGGNSGDGSYDRLAEFKAEFINDFVKTHKIQSIIEIGCGDGNQLNYANYPNYVGYDVSEDALKLCRSKFEKDNTKRFNHLDALDDNKADLSLSLDVIYHLIEDKVYETHMDLLFSLAEKYVIIYSSNSNHQQKLQAPHVKHRQFTEWTNHLKSWELIEIKKNIYPFDGNTEKTSFADFYVFKKV